jgi:hypothetical protein
MLLHKFFERVIIPPMKQKTLKTERLNLAAEPEFIRKLDEWRRKQPDIPSRSEALRRTSLKTLDADLETE